MVGQRDGDILTHDDLLKKPYRFWPPLLNFPSGQARQRFPCLDPSVMDHTVPSSASVVPSSSVPITSYSSTTARRRRPNSVVSSGTFRVMACPNPTYSLGPHSSSCAHIALSRRVSYVVCAVMLARVAEFTNCPLYVPSLGTRAPIRSS